MFLMMLIESYSVTYRPQGATHGSNLQRPVLRSVYVLATDLKLAVPFVELHW